MRKLAVTTTYERFGGNREVIDSAKTKKAIINILKERGIKPVLESHTDKNGNRYKDYPIDVTGVDTYYGSTSTQFRVYFKIGRKRSTFIQSDKEGRMDVGKLLTKTAEAFALAQSEEDKKVEEQKQKKVDEAYIKRVNKTLKGTGFEVDKVWFGFEIKHEAYNAEELDKFIAKAFPNIK